jgi:hypothetical protein
VNTDEFLAQLRDEVVSADERHRAVAEAPTTPTPIGSPARRSRLRWLGAAAVLVLVAGAGVVLRPAPVAAGVEVLADADGLTIRLTDLQTRPDEVETAASDAGLDVTVTEVPVGPSQVGRFVGLSATGGSDQIQITEGTSETGFTAFRLPRGFDHSIDLRIGRAAEPGEELAVTSDATAEGEILECRELIGLPLSDALEIAKDAGASPVRVNVLDEGRWLSPREFDDYGDLIVEWASAAAGNEVQLFTTFTPQTPAATNPPPENC